SADRIAASPLARSRVERLRAPRAEVPEARVDAPATMPATRFAPLELPRTPGLRAAPWAVTHERHQRSAAPLVAALRDVALVREVARGLGLEAGPVARGAVAPVELDAAAAARAFGRMAAVVPRERRVGAAPWATLHRLRDRARAVPALVARVERP